MAKLSKYLQRIQNLGFLNFVKYTWHQKTKLPRTGEFVLHSKFCDSPLCCRAGTSDIDVFKHMFVVREYECLEFLESPGLIIDCGANAGFSSACLLSLFPQTRVVSVEPDPGNFAMLRKNTAAFGDRCQPVHAGIWSKSCGLKFSEEVFGDGREWAVSVREAKEGETADVEAVDIPALLQLSKGERIALLKVDIEGSEAELFGPSSSDWLPLVDNIIIELHGSECSQLYLKAVEQAGFQSKVVGGLTLSTRVAAS